MCTSVSWCVSVSLHSAIRIFWLQPGYCLLPQIPLLSCASARVSPVSLQKCIDYSGSRDTQYTCSVACDAHAESRDVLIIGKCYCAIISAVIDRAGAAINMWFVYFHHVWRHTWNCVFLIKYIRNWSVIDYRCQLMKTVTDRGYQIKNRVQKLKIAGQ